MIKRGKKIDKVDLSVFDNPRHSKVDEPTENVFSFDESQDLTLQIAYRLGDNKIVEDVKKLLSVPPMHKLDILSIGNIISTNPLLEGRWTFIVNEAVAEYEYKELEFEIFQAECDAKIRLNNSEGKLSEPRIKNLIMSDPKYKELSRELIELKKSMNNLKGMANAIASKGLKAVSLASLVKQEMKMTNQI